MHPRTSMIPPSRERPFSPGELKFVNNRSGFVERLLDASLVLPEDWLALPSEVQDELSRCDDPAKTLIHLVDHNLLTEYQADRVSAGTTYGLVLGNYRVLDRLGAGGMAVVFKAEHMEMRRLAAVKVLPLAQDQHAKLLPRFIAEMRIVAQLQHPNIVAAFDAGRTVPPDPDSPILRYFVMEYVPGQNLEEFVDQMGGLPPAKACDFIHQIASALVEANKLNLVHRDIKPSNIIVTPEGQAKLLDFGLVRSIGNHLTEVGTVLGTLDFMAPEQLKNASCVDIRSDLYGLGGTLYWCLTGQTPFPDRGAFHEFALKRLTQAPPNVRDVRPEISPQLDALVARLMALNPAERFATPQELMRALLPFLRPDSSFDLCVSSEIRSVDARPNALGSPTGGHRAHRLLIVDDEPSIRSFCRHIFQAEGIECDEAANGRIALEALAQKPYDLLLVDNHMPEITGMELLQKLRSAPPSPHMKIVMISGMTSSDEMAKMLLAGADDFLTKPFSMVQLKSRVQTALRLKVAQDQADLLNQHLLTVNGEMERNLSARNSDLVDARNALVLALARLVAHRDTESGQHLARLQRYSRCLAEEAAKTTHFANQIDSHFIEMIEASTPLHDIGKIALPDYILMKPGKLTSDERILMQAHTSIGADTLAEVAQQHGFALAFLSMACDIARHHHERFDGTGYPDRLAGNDIPLAARIVAFGDVYDALRSRRIYKPALSHSATLQLMKEGSVGHFDPALIPVFTRCAERFEQIYHEVPD